jgi:formiminotetrahydrofolate cyclodeaminase
VSYFADILRQHLNSLILNLTKGKERYVELLDETLKKELQENFQIANISSISNAPISRRFKEYNS